MAATNNTHAPQQTHYYPPQYPNTQHTQASHDYYYTTPHQLYPYMSVFYSNVQTHNQTHSPPLQPPPPINRTYTQVWPDHNRSKCSLSASPQQLMTNTNSPNPIVLNDPKSSNEDWDNGYWNIPKPKYGPLASQHQMDTHSPRIGGTYQAMIPQIVSPKPERDTITFEDECVWDTHKVDPTALDQYLKVAQFVLGTSRTCVYTDCHYDEEAALYLLKLHNYDITDAINTLRLNKPDKNNPNFAWLFSKKNKTHMVCTDMKDANDNTNDSDCDTTDNNEYMYQYSNRTMSIVKDNSQNTDKNANDNGSGMYDDEDYCFACGDGGTLLVCDKPKCMKVWHTNCAGLTKFPSEDEWFCPSHICYICKSESQNKYQCSYCGNAYCNLHCPNECMRYDYCNIEFLCKVCLSQMDGSDDKHKFALERFMSRLLELHKRKNSARNSKESESGDSVPKHCVIERNEIEWFDLYCAVISEGGLSEIKDLHSWDAIRDKCKMSANFQSENVWISLRDSYIEYLYCYEKQYFPDSGTVLPRGIQSIVDNKGALDGLGYGNGNKTPENVNDMVVDID